MVERLIRRFLTFDISKLNLSCPIRYERYYINDELRIQKKDNVYEKEILKDNVVISKEKISFDEFLTLKEKAYKEIIRDSYLYLDDKRVSIKKYYGMYECLNHYHDIVFLDATDLDEEEKYTDGMLFLPSTITSKQFEMLEAHLDYFENFDSISIEGGCEFLNINVLEPAEGGISEIIEGRVFKDFLEETIQGLVQSKHK